MQRTLACKNTLIFFSLLLLLLHSISCENLFYLQRIPSSCIETIVNVSTNNNVMDNCFTYDWQQIVNFTTNYTTYINSDGNETYYAQIGALTVLGTMNNYDLNYHCPPLGYNGVPTGCLTQPNTQLVVLHINTVDGKLYSIDVILSGTPFRSVDSLVENQPPFGKARHVFSSGIVIQTSGYLQICKSKSSSQCPNGNISTYKLPHPLPSNTGYGIFGSQTTDLVTDSIWIMDDVNQLLILSSGTNYYYFNASGFFMYDYGSNTCVWRSSCNYQCEVYNYDSRFLDYAGEWIITKKWGINQIEPVAVKAWIGNAIDAAGIFPIIMYTDNETGHYIGLDKLDPSPASKMGATYWYIVHDDTKPKTSIETFHPNVADLGCVSELMDWTGIMNNCEILMKLNNSRMIILLLLSAFFII